MLKQIFKYIAMPFVAVWGLLPSKLKYALAFILFVPVSGATLYYWEFVDYVRVNSTDVTTTNGVSEYRVYTSYNHNMLLPWFSDPAETYYIKDSYFPYVHDAQSLYSGLSGVSKTDCVALPKYGFRFSWQGVKQFRYLTDFEIVDESFCN